MAPRATRGRMKMRSLRESGAIFPSDDSIRQAEASPRLARTEIQDVRNVDRARDDSPLHDADGQLRGKIDLVVHFLHQPRWKATLDRFSSAAIDVGPQAIAMRFSPVGDGGESYAKLLDLIVGARRLPSAGVPTIAWRQGVYGPALVAAGLDGYECGMGIGEQSRARAFMSSHRPRRTGGRGFAAEGVFISALSRGVPRKAARLLLDDRSLKGRLICDSVRCCPHGAESMLASRGRPHAVHARAGGLQELAEIPSVDWRLHHVGKEAASGYVAATKANEVLARSGLANRVKPESYAALEQIADFLRHKGIRDVRDSA